MPERVILPEYCIYDQNTSIGKDALLKMCREKGIECDRVANVKSTKRACEILAELLLVNEAFGPEAELCHNENGAPYIKNNPADISISHSRYIVCLAVSLSKTIGIDVEFNSEKIVRVRSRFLSSRELLFIPEDDLELNNRAWCAKESIYKAASIEGVDIRKDIVINDDNISSGTLNYNGLTMQFKIKHHSLGQYTVTVASVITR